MKWSGVLLLGLFMLGAAPHASTFIAGSVRDQDGAPIEGARVELFAAGARTGVASTRTDGTFAVANVAADSAKIRCAFCEPERVGIGSDGILVAIVRRYDAVRAPSPTPDDIAHLPYAGLESALSLAPFLVLDESLQPFPGNQVSDRRISGHGGVLNLNGVAVYDVANNLSPYGTIPQHDFSDFTIEREQNAYVYGDTANAGAFFSGTTDGAGFASAGNDRTVRVMQPAGVVVDSAAYSSGPFGDERARADARASLALPGLAGYAALGFGRGTQSYDPYSTLDQSFSSATVSLRRTSGADISATLSADRGTYDYTTAPYPENAIWSDVDAQAMIRSDATLAPFALVSLRRSAAQSSLGQTRGVMGFTLDEPHLDAVAALGSDVVSYGAYDGTPQQTTTVHDGVLSATWSPSNAVSLEASTSRGYTLPTFAAAYNIIVPTQLSSKPTLYSERNSTLESTLTLSDLERVRVSLTALRFTNPSGFSSGSAGASIAWQVSPRISIRTWLLRVSDTLNGAPSVGSAWLTYDSGGFRFDAIVRRDLNGNIPDAHIDAAISGALAPRLSWFVETERRNGIQTTDAGVRW